MKKYYFTAAIAIIAIILLQYIFISNLYNNFREKNNAKFNEAIRIALSLENFHYQNYSGKPLKYRRSVTFLNEMSKELQDSLLAIHPLPDTIPLRTELNEKIEIIPLLKSGDINSAETLLLLENQDFRIQNGKTINLHILDSLFFVIIEQHHDRYITLCDANEQILDSIGNPKLNHNYEVLNVKIGTKNIYSLNIYLDLPLSEFIKESIYIMILSLIIMSLAIVIAIYLVVVIRRKQRIIEYRNNSINGVIHDLKTPLAAATTMLSVLKISEQNPSKTKLIENNINTLNNLANKVNLLLKAAKSKNISVIKQKYSLEQLTEHTKLTIENITRYYQTSKNKTTSFSVKYSGFNPKTELYIDKLHWDSIISNLVDNAIKYSNQNPIINITIENQEPNTLHITVKDNGIGISKFQQLFIFKEFYRAPSIINIEEGAGIGLSYLKIITKAHGGSIAVSSAKNSGSTFFVTINTENRNEL